VSRAVDSDGHAVFIKSIPAGDNQNEELRILQLLSLNDERVNDPRNHSVPIRDIMFYNPDFASYPRYKRERDPSDSRAFVVTEELEPLPRNLVNDYVPETVGDCLEFARQCLEVRISLVDFRLMLTRALTGSIISTRPWDRSWGGSPTLVGVRTSSSNLHCPGYIPMEHINVGILQR
jgi:hypothetical protein